VISLDSIRRIEESVGGHLLIISSRGFDAPLIPWTQARGKKLRMLEFMRLIYWAFFALEWPRLLLVHREVFRTAGNHRYRSNLVMRICISLPKSSQTVNVESVPPAKGIHCEFF
jgi:hypothetical protein